MCTVSCIINNNQIILTSNRDIPIDRTHSIPPKIYIENKINVLMPLDPKGNGSWIGTTSHLIACILNHRGKDSSINSRGELLFKVLTKQININDLEKKSKHYNSFQLIYLDKKNKKYYEYIWDGNNFKYKPISSNINIWSSNTIYNKHEIKDKLDFFNQYSKKGLDEKKMMSLEVTFVKES